MPADEQESDIIRRAVSGDKEAFRLLVLRYQQVIYTYFMRQLADQHKAQDLAQEVFLRAYRSVKKFRGQSSFLTWLYKIAINCCSSYLSSAEFRERKASSPIDPESDQLKASAFESNSSEHLASKLKVTVQKLKPIYRDVLVLCSFEAKTYEETANILEIPIGTVCSRMNKALSILRIELSKEEL